jgi:hypothetical protein
LTPLFSFFSDRTTRFSKELAAARAKGGVEAEKKLFEVTSNLTPRHVRVQD